jgi:hypothetical protein
MGGGDARKKEREREQETQKTVNTGLKTKKICRLT